MFSKSHPIVLLLFLLAAPPAAGQERPGVPEFATVRLTSPTFTGEGTLVRVGPDALELGIEGQARSIRVPLESLTRLEYRCPATGRERATRGAIWGAGTLGVLAFLITDRSEGTSEVEAALNSVVAGALWGGAIGFLIRQNRWQRADHLAAQGSGAP